METIKTIVNYLDIPAKKKKVDLNREEIAKCNVAMSNMTFNINVAKYAYDLNKLQELLAANRTEDLEEIKRLRKEITDLEKFKEVREYQAVINYKKTLEDQISDYYQTLHIALREELLDQQLPEIYIHQGFINTDKKYKLARHIVIPNSAVMYSLDELDTIILPEDQTIESNRKARHFYNQMSFRYLEQLTEDYSFGLESKHLGKVKIQRRS